MSEETQAETAFDFVLKLTDNPEEAKALSKMLVKWSAGDPNGFPAQLALMTRSSWKSQAKILADLEAHRAALDASFNQILERILASQTKDKTTIQEDISDKLSEILLKIQQQPTTVPEARAAKPPTTAEAPSSPQGETAQEPDAKVDDKKESTTKLAETIDPDLLGIMLKERISVPVDEASAEVAEKIRAAAQDVGNINTEAQSLIQTLKAIGIIVNEELTKIVAEVREVPKAVQFKLSTAYVIGGAVAGFLLRGLLH